MPRSSTHRAPRIVQGKGYDSEGAEGARIWGQVQLALARRMPMEHAVAEHRYGKPILMQLRLGQGAFHGRDYYALFRG